ncbi:MAG TPA: hypothetical protein PKL13_01445 [bacterium]|nr:hypothetical protein [bacterium]
MLEAIIIATIVIIPTILIFWLVFVFIITIYQILNRGKVLEQLSKQLNIEFQKKDTDKLTTYPTALAPLMRALINSNKNYALSGQYLGQNINIEEFNTQMNPFYTDTSIKKIETYNTFGFQPTKKLIVTVDDKIIYEKNGDRLLPFPNKIKKILDKYIKEGKITKNETSPILAVIVLFGFCIIFTILFLTFILN